MAAFPTMTHPVTGRTMTPNRSLVLQPKEQPGLQWRLANGYQKSRLKEESRPDIWKIVFDLVPQGLKDDIIDFEENTVTLGVTEFTFPDPVSGGTWTVKLLRPITYNLLEAEGSLWRISFVLEVVI